jgi:glucokinase
LERPLRREYAGCGCFEHHASGAGLAKIANELLLHRSNRSTRLKSHHSSAPALHSSNSLTAQDVFAAYKRGDPVAKKTLAQAVQFWGMAVANLVSLFNPEKIVFGGGVFGPATQFLDEIQTEARKWAQPIAFKQVKLQASRLGGDAGLYGAAYLALQSLSRKP